MKRDFKLQLLQVLTVLLAIPLVVKLPYMFNAWLYSPLDRTDVVFWGLAVGWSAIREWRYWRRHEVGGHAAPYRWLAAVAMIPALLLWWMTVRYEVNTLSILVGIVLIGLGVWFAGGWKRAEAHLPAFILAALGCPSTSYWTEFYLGGLTGIPLLNGFELKLLFAILLITVWSAARIMLRRSISPHGAIFFAAVGIVAGMMLIRSTELPPGSPLRLEPIMRKGDWIGKEQNLTALDRQFFSGSDVVRRVYFDYAGFVSVLAVKPGEDVHQIHPIGICLRSAGWTILSQRQVLLPVSNLQCEALEIMSGRGRYLIYSWFTNDDISTGNFRIFRRRWHSGRNWYVFQVMTPVVGSEAFAAERLNTFIRLFRL